MRPYPTCAWRCSASSRARGSVLIIVLWIAFGLVSLTLYFGQSMVFEYRAAENGAAGVAADQAIEGAARYVAYALTNNTDQGFMPLTNYLHCEALPVGDATVWLVGRGPTTDSTDIPVYGLVDEASKLNINTATVDMLLMLPRMTPELAEAIVDWRDSDEQVSTNGAESETYERLATPYLAKNSNFETEDELRLVSGSTLEILYGEDTNMNGLLDPNENDGDASSPPDNQDGRLDAGILEFVTVFSREPLQRSDGTNRININESSSTTLQTRLQEVFGQSRAQEIRSRVQSGAGSYQSLMAFYLASGMSVQEFAKIAVYLTVTNASYVEGLVNINTASSTVLACIPGIGTEKAEQVVAYRKTLTTNELYSVAWLTQVLDQDAARQAGPYITTFSYQFTADIAAVGENGRGYRRSRFVFDTTEDHPKIIYRQDLSRQGWALGNESRRTLLVGKEYR